WSDKAIASSGHVRDIAGIVPTISERFAERCDMDVQIGVFNSHIGPNSRDQLLMADDLSSLLDKRDQKIQRPTADCDRLAVLLQQPFGCKQSEGAKHENVVGRRVTQIGHGRKIHALNTGIEGIARSGDRFCWTRPRYPAVLLC